MRNLLPCVAIVLFCAAHAGSAASAGERGGCKKAAVETLHASESGDEIFRRLKDKSFLYSMLNCEDRLYCLPTAVHETVHYLTADDDAYPLVDGSKIKRPEEASKFFAPSRIAPQFAGSDFASTYLHAGRAESARNFIYLLDEMNAYTHGLQVAVDLKDVRHPGYTGDHRDGLAALMAFVAVYAERARASEPATWAGLQRADVADAVTALWERSEKVMQSSCGLPNLGMQSKTYIRRYCEGGAKSALATIIGRAPVCPKECLEAADDVAQADSEEEAAPAPARRTLWSRGAGSRVTVRVERDDQPDEP